MKRNDLLTVALVLAAGLAIGRTGNGVEPSSPKYQSHPPQYFPPSAPATDDAKDADKTKATKATQGKSVGSVLGACTGGLCGTVTGALTGCAAGAKDAK